MFSENILIFICFAAVSTKHSKGEVRRCTKHRPIRWSISEAQWGDIIAILMTHRSSQRIQPFTILTKPEGRLVPGASVIISMPRGAPLTEGKLNPIIYQDFKEKTELEISAFNENKTFQFWIRTPPYNIPIQIQQIYLLYFLFLFYYNYKTKSIRCD